MNWNMFRRIVIVGVALIAPAAVGGCTPNVAGSWEVVDVQPRGASFPFNRVSFDQQGKYTSTGIYDAQGRLSDDVHTATGQFERKGRDVRLVPAKGTAVVYKTRRRFDGKLEMTLEVPGQNHPLTAVLGRVNY